MMQSARWIDSSEYARPVVHASKRLSFLRFFLRYPIFLLAFGPPQFKGSGVLTDTSQAHFDIWNIISVGWISVIALRAILRLAATRSILIPKQIRSILKFLLFLGLLFTVSVIYSPGRVISAEFCVLYFLTLICVIEFIVDVYRDPPNWMQCIFQLRLVALLLSAVVLVTLYFEPSFVMSVVPGTGIRLLGGSVANMALYPETIAIISAYTFLNSLESRVRSMLFFLVGLAGTLIAQSRGVEISLLVVLLAIAIGWAKMSKRSAYIFVVGLMASILIGGVVIGSIGVERIWRAFNRGEDSGNLLTGNGRTVVWAEVIQYCITHPQGMGYIAGIRHTHRVGAATSMHALLNKNGGVDSSYIQVLGDAGWLALALYLIMLTKTVALGWRSMRKLLSGASASENVTQHSLRCALFLLMFCLAEGVESQAFVTPLQGAFYFQNIVIAVILGASASVLIASRPRRPSLVR
jgi:hypothetical protein